MRLDVVIGSGGVLSHAPERMQAAIMMLDGFALEGLTQLTVDSIFMMPHLGVFASVHPEAAREIFENDCVVHLGCAVVPTYPVRSKMTSLARVLVNGNVVGEVVAGSVDRIHTDVKGGAQVRIEPTHSSVNVGAGPGQPFERHVQLGECGIICDGRNRPIIWGDNTVADQQKIFRNLGLVAT
jgi:hypothetical protein